MTPGQQRRKDTTEEMRREQQADERIRELEQEVERLRRRIEQIKGMIEAGGPTIDVSAQRLLNDIHDACTSALDGGEYDG